MSTLTGTTALPWVAPGWNPGRDSHRFPRDLARSRRVILLILAMVLMGLADLACTLTYMRSVGMVEMNPIARHMIDLAGARQLVLFKLFTMVLSCGLIYLLRFHRRAETVAWACTCVLLGLMVHWVRYNSEAPKMTNEIALLASGDANECWVVLDD